MGGRIVAPLLIVNNNYSALLFVRNCYLFAQIFADYLLLHAILFVVNYYLLQIYL